MSSDTESRRHQIRILHASDLHASANQALDQGVLVKALLKDLEAFQKDVPIDLVVFSGDLAFSGKAEDFELARTMFLQPLMESMSLTPEQVVLVPGNHDIDRSRINEYVEAGLQLKLTDRDAVNSLLAKQVELRTAVERLEPWRDFSKTFYQSAPVNSVYGLGWHALRSIGGLNIGIAAANSAWRATGLDGDADRGNLIVGDHQVQQMVSTLAASDLPIVVVHHPFDWLKLFDQDDIRRETDRAGALVFSGHLHVADPHSIATARGSAILARAGCLYTGRSYLNSYSIVDVDLRERTADFNVRSWWPDRGVFDKATNVAANGVIRLPLPSSGTTTLLVVPYSDVTRSLVDVVQRTSVVGDLIEETPHNSVSEFLVPPRFFPLPFSQIAAASKTEGGATIGRLDALGDLAKNRIVVVSGDSESGVTSALVWLLDRHYSSDGTKFPLYAEFSERKGGGVLDQDLREAASRAGLRLVGVTDPQLVVAIDDVAGLEQRWLDRLIHYMDLHQNWLFVLGCHGDATDAVTAALATAGLSHSVAFLAPFGRRELKALVKRIGPDGDSNMPDRILDVLSEKGLPRTPFLMAALVAVMHRDADTSKLNATALVEQYVNLLLGRTNLVGGDFLDFRKREHLLAFIAANFTRSHVTRLDWLEIERIVVEYLEVRGLRTESPGRILERLIRRRVLVEHGGSVGFRHLTVQHLFAAKWMIEDQEFRDLITADPLAYAEIVRHAAALSRSDKALLDRVGGAASDVVTGADDALSGEGFEEILDHGGNAAASAVEKLSADLKRLAPISPEVLDERMDEYWEGKSEGGDVNAIAVLSDEDTVLIEAVHLLSSVLTSSELVDDKALKVELLKLAVQGWSVACVRLAANEQAAERLSETLGQILFEGRPTPAQVLRINRVVKVIIVFGGSIMAVSTLGSRQNATVLDEASDDDEFMAVAMHALICALIAVSLNLPGWPKRLIELSKRHGHHGFVADVVYTLAISRYQSVATADEDARSLEEFLTPLILERSGTKAFDQTQRERLRNQIAKRLKLSRTTAKIRGSRLDILVSEIEDDEEPHTPEEGGDLI